MINMFTGSPNVCKIPEFNTRDGVRYMPMIVESSHGWLVMNYNTSKGQGSNFQEKALHTYLLLYLSL